MIHENYNRVLVVDDNTKVSAAFEEFLTGNGYKVKTADDGQSAVDAAKSENFDVIVLDLTMPGMGGIEAFKLIKKLEPEPAVIIMTGFASLETAIQAVKLGAFDYLTKPFPLDDFLSSVERACEKVFMREQQKV